MINLSEQILKELEQRSAAPRPRWHFLLTRTAFWILAIASVLVGAVAFSVASFVFFDNDGMSIASLQQSSIQDVAQSIPFIWLFVLALFTVSAHFGFRQTRTGYRYSTALVVSAAIVVSVGLGLALNTLDFGQYVHQYLLKHTGFYDGLIHSRDDVVDQSD